MADDESSGIGALLAGLGGSGLRDLFGSYAGVGEAMPEAYGAKAPIMDPLVTAPLSIAKMVSGPGDLVKPNPYPEGSEGWHWYEDQRDKGMKDWSTSTAMNLAGTSAPFAPVGAAGVFGGRLAKTADLGALRTAEEMHAAGADRSAIWDKTGWFQGSDGKWRFEIPDDKAQMNPNVYGSGIPPGRWGKIAGEVWHKDLYDAYPGIRNATGMIESRAPGTGGSGSYLAPGVGEERINVQAPTPAEARSVALHELQHAVQEREGFAQGGSPAMFTQGDDAKIARDALAYRRELSRLKSQGIPDRYTPKQKDEIIRQNYAAAGMEDMFPPQAVRDVAHDVEGNPRDTLRKVMELYGTDKRLDPFSPRELYRQIPGEIEARNVQARADMTPAERRARPPWETADVSGNPILNQMFGKRVGLLER